MKKASTKPTRKVCIECFGCADEKDLRCSFCGVTLCAKCAFTEPASECKEMQIPSCTWCRKKIEIGNRRFGDAMSAWMDNINSECCVCESPLYRIGKPIFYVANRCHHIVCAQCADNFGRECAACGCTVCDGCAYVCQCCQRAYSYECWSKHCYQCRDDASPSGTSFMCEECTRTKGVCVNCAVQLADKRVSMCTGCCVLMCGDCFDLVPHACNKCALLMAAKSTDPITIHFKIQ